MLSKSLIALAVSASGALAATPSGFEPGSQTGLLVTFGNVEAAEGAVVPRETTQTAPTIATQSKLDGTSFAILVVDIDIPADFAPPPGNKFLHWLQTGLTQSSSAVSLSTSNGPTSAFVFSVPEDEAAFAPYLGPAPPARIPLSHRYTEIIIDTSDVSKEGLAALEAAAATRLGFDTLSVLTSAGLADKVVAGSFFNVTNPGPVLNSTTGGGNDTNSNPPPSQTSVPIAAGSQLASASLLTILMAGVALFAL